MYDKDFVLEVIFWTHEDKRMKFPCDVIVKVRNDLVPKLCTWILGFIGRDS